jgi:HNH endonuclease/AP2 domain
MLVAAEFEEQQMSVTQARLKELVIYDPETGEFRWRVSRPGAHAGDLCGRINSYGYREIGVDRVLYRAQRLAVLYMTGSWPTKVVDHVNRDRADNQWVNLRQANQSCNSVNAALKRSNTSGLIGVTWDSDRQKWRAQIRINGRKTNLGRFASPKEAAIAHDAAARACFGEFARLNFPNHECRPPGEPSTSRPRGHLFRS